MIDIYYIYIYISTDKNVEIKKRKKKSNQALFPFKFMAKLIFVECNTSKGSYKNKTREIEQKS